MTTANDLLAQALLPESVQTEGSTMNEQERRLWDLFSRLFAGEWPRIASINIGHSISEDGGKHSLAIRLTADWDVFPIGDWDKYYFGEASGEGTMEHAVENVLSQLRVSVDKARDVRQWHESIMQNIGRRLLIRGEEYQLAGDTQRRYRETRYRNGEDTPGQPPYMDMPGFNFVAADHVRVVPPRTVCNTMEWRKGYILAECESGLIWVPAHHLKPSSLGKDGPVAGTEHAVWI